MIEAQSSMFKIQNFGKNVQRGFTLIELLIVIVIIGILSTLVMANFVGIRARARDAQRKTDLRQIQTALQLYNADLGYYPSADLLQNANCNSPLAGSGTSSGVTYMKTIPCDPLKKTPYVYNPTNASGGLCLNGTNNCTSYTLYACLENGADNDTDQKKGLTPQSCTNGYSFTVTNP